METIANEQATTARQHIRIDADAAPALLINKPHSDLNPNHKYDPLQPDVTSAATSNVGAFPDHDPNPQTKTTRGQKKLSAIKTDN